MRYFLLFDYVVCAKSQLPISLHCYYVMTVLAKIYY